MSAAFVTREIAGSGYPGGMAEPFQIEPLGEHAYLVRGREGAETLESRFRVDEDLLSRLGVSAAEEVRVVAETAMFLAERQPLGDIPSLVDLEDVAARYEEYLPSLSRRMGR